VIRLEKFVKQLRKVISTVINPSELENKLGHFEENNVSILKKTRWEDDAIILLFIKINY